MTVRVDFDRRVSIRCANMPGPERRRVKRVTLIDRWNNPSIQIHMRGVTTDMRYCFGDMENPSHEPVGVNCYLTSTKDIQISRGHVPDAFSGAEVKTAKRVLLDSTVYPWLPGAGGQLLDVKFKMTQIEDSPGKTRR